MSRFHLIACAGVSLLALAAPAQAQEAPTDDDSAMSGSEIVVEARRRGESVQDVPLVVQAVTGADLQKLEIRQFEDVAKLVPGLQLATNASGVGGTSTLRGINFDALASGASFTVEFYRNDAPVTTAPLFQAAYDIGQIEVLRGPQGTLRGKASPSGSITVTTRRPDLGEVGGFASGSLSDAHRWNVNGAINVPVIRDKLAVRVAGFVGEHRGNEVKGLNLRTGAIDDDLSDRSKAIRASVRADPFDGVLVLDFNYEGIHHANRAYDQVRSLNLVTTAGVSPVTIRPGDRLGVGAIARDNWQTYKLYNWQAQLRQWGQQLTYVGGHNKGWLYSLAPSDVAGIFGAGSGLASPGTPFATVTDTATMSESHELRLQNEEPIAGLFDYVIGGFQLKARSPSISLNPTGAGSTTTLYNVAIAGRLRYRVEQERSLFGNLTLHLGDRTELSGGLRRIWFKADSGLTTGPLTADPSTWAEIPSARRCFGNPAVAGCLPTKKTTIYTLSAKHNFTEDLMVYASFGTSWRPGNSVVGYGGATVGTFLSQFLNLPDETSKSYEVGFKSSWLDDRLRFNVTGFYQKFVNLAYRVSSPVISLSTVTPTPTLAPGFNFVAPVPAEVKGFEAELSFEVSPSFNIASTLAFADGKIKNGVFPCLDVNKDNVPDTGAPPTAAALFAAVGQNQVGTCTANASPSASPRWSGTVMAEYTQPFGDGMTGYLRGFLNWKGNSPGDALNPYDQVRAYGVFDAFAGVRDPDGGWEIGLFAKNLLGTSRVLTSTGNALTTSLSGTQSLVPFGGTGTSAGAQNLTNYLGITTLAPREIGVNLRIAFGGR